MKYCVDIVLCIDSTGSMSPVIDEAKEGALKFQEDLMASMIEKGKNIDVLRIKVISYRDYYCDGEMAMVESPYFVLPADKNNYEDFIHGINADGGGDEPESGLEALTIAINSDWTHEGDKRRHVICLWTDASSHPLEGTNDGLPKPSTYPPSMPANFKEMTNLWENKMVRNSKRLLIYGPDAYPWTDISNIWENTLHYVSKAGKGLEDIDYKTIIQVIAASIEGQ